MKFQDRGGAILVQGFNRQVQRHHQPVVLTLNEAVDWIKRNKPILWVGSALSGPEPAGLPSGASITESILNALFPLADAWPEDVRSALFSTLARRWPLEALLDEFQLVDFDISADFLEAFKKANIAAKPCALHDAVVRYYTAGYANSSMCITTNWDNFLEVAFRHAGWNVDVAGPGRSPAVDGILETTKSIVIFHPHGSFESKDCVCSSSQEQRPLDIRLDKIRQPTLFLGYSGYEPSIYQWLEHDAGQLWCVKSKTEFEIPAKRRLLSRPNTFVYVGDLQDLLSALGVLSERQTNSDKIFLPPDLPGALTFVVQTSLLASTDPNVCVHALGELLKQPMVGPPYDFKRMSHLVLLTRGLVNHVRDRSTHDEILPMLIRLAETFRSEQLWNTVVAHHLRQQLCTRTADHEEFLAKAAASADEKSDLGELLDSIICPPQNKAKLSRGNLYRRYIRGDGKAERPGIYALGGSMVGDLAFAAECLEIEAFEYLRDGETEQAKNIFDCAATYYYLRGLWNAGYLNEQAAKNPEFLMEVVENRSLMM